MCIINLDKMEKKEFNLLMEGSHFKKGDLVSMGNGSNFTVKKCPNDKSKFWRFISKITFGLYKTRKYYTLK